MDTDLLSDAAKETITSWVHEYSDALFRFALFRVGQREVAEDLVQETFCAALQSFRSFENRSAPKTWLVSILKFKIIDYLRKSARGGESIADLQVIEDERKRNFTADGDWIQRQQKWTKEPGEALEEQQFFQQIQSCLHALPRSLRSLMVLRAIDDRDASEIGEDLGIATPNVWVGLYRARMKIKECLDKRWFTAK